MDFPYFFEWWVQHWPLIPVIAPGVWITWEMFIKAVREWVKGGRK